MSRISGIIVFQTKKSNLDNLERVRLRFIELDSSFSCPPGPRVYRARCLASSIVKSSSISDGARWMKTEHEWISSSVSSPVRFPEIDGRSSSVDMWSSMDPYRARLPR